MRKNVLTAILMMVPAAAGARDLREVVAEPGSVVLYTDLSTLKEGTVQTWTGKFSREITGDVISYSGITIAIDCPGNRRRSVKYQLFDAKGTLLKTQEATKDWQPGDSGSNKTLIDIVCGREAKPSPRLGDVDPFLAIARYFEKDMAQ